MNRALIRKQLGAAQPAMQGDGMFNPTVFMAPDAAITLTAGQILGGAVYGVVTAPRTYTTPTGALLDAANTDMNVGESFSFELIGTGGAITLAGGAGVTVLGGLQVDGIGSNIIVTKTGVALYTMYSF